MKISSISRPDISSNKRENILNKPFSAYIFDRKDGKRLRI